MKRLGKVLFVAFLMVGGASTAYAANDGTLGTSSTGDFDITVTVAELIQISGMTDVTFGTYSGSGDLDNDYQVCVYRNNASAQYTITATATEGAFQVENGGDNIPYTVFFNDVTGTAGEVALTYNTATATQTGANTQATDCSTGGNSANVHIRMLEADLQAAPANSYSGTVILQADPV